MSLAGKSKTQNQKQLLTILGILTIALIVYNRWFFHFSPLTFGDWLYHDYKSLITMRINYFFLWWPDGIGKVLVDAGQAPTYALYGFLAKYLGLEYPILERLIHMWPIALVTPLSAYFFFKDIFSKWQAVFVGVSVYSFNTYCLILQTGHLTLMGAIMVAPLIFYFYFRYTSRKKYSYGILAALTLFISSSYEPRVALILTATLFLYIIYKLRDINYWGDRFKYLFRCSMPFLVFGLLSSFWIIGLSFSGGLASNSLFDRSLFGDQFFKLSNAFTLFHPFWTGAQPSTFIVQPVPIYFWLIPITAVAGLMMNRHDRRIIFFGIITILGILLAKQSDSPFHQLYGWLFQHVPIFKAYREASKFYILIVIGYSTLIAAFVNKITMFKNPLLGNILTMALIGLFLFNAYPLMTGRVRNTFVDRKLPSDYSLLENFFKDDSDFSRTLWIPRESRWGAYSSIHPKVSAIKAVREEFASLIGDYPADKSMTIAQEIDKVVTNPISQWLLSNASIQYVIVPIRDIDNEDDFYINYGNNRQHFIDVLSKVDWLKKIDIGTKDLAVYENANYRPYFSSFKDLKSLSNDASLEPIYNFHKEQLKNGFDFVLGDEQIPESASRLLDLFQNIHINEISNGKIKKIIDVNKQTSYIYANTNMPKLVYSIAGDHIAFMAQYPTGVKVDGQITDNKVENQVLLSVPIDPSKGYFVGRDEKLDIVSISEDKQRNLGTIDNPLRLYSAENNTNLVHNGSLEDGLWQKDIMDCNDYDNNALISMKIVNDRMAQGKQSLALKSNNHIACTGPAPITVKSNDTYLFSFAYQTENTQQTGYEIQFNDPGNTIIKSDLPASYNKWRVFRHAIQVPSGATSVSIVLKGYPDDHRVQNATTFFDDLQLSKLTFIEKLTPKAQQDFSHIKLPLGRTEIELDDPNYDYQNLINNPSFEDGLWQEKVGDCNAYDDKPSIEMTLNNKDKSDGNNSLQLEAKRHIACTSSGEIGVDESSTYLFTFDYQSPNADVASYYISFNDPENTTISEDIPIKTHEWQTFTKQIKTPYGATAASVVLYAHSKDVGGIKIINRYDNFKFIKIPDLANNYYFVEKPERELSQLKQIDYESINPTKKLVHIKGATTPFFLAMSEGYHPKWQLEISDSRIKGLFGGWVPWAKPSAIANEHFKLDGILNGWYVDVDKLCGEQKLCTQNADGSYDLEMIAEFTPQRWFYLGSLMSATTFLGCIGYLGWDWRKSRRAHYRSYTSKK